MVRERFNEKSGDMLDAVNAACKYAYVNMEYLDRNFETWDVMKELICQEPMPLLMLENCTEQVQFLGEWLVNRQEWLDGFYNSEMFMSEYKSGPELEYGVTEVINADVWTIADWFEGDKLAQVYMDILFSSVETKDGRIMLEFGNAVTLTPENFAKLTLEFQLGAEPGRFVFVFEEGELEEVYKNYKSQGYGYSAGGFMHFKIRDLVTGEESLMGEYEFVCIKRYEMNAVLGNPV